MEVRTSAVVNADPGIDFGAWMWRSWNKSDHDEEEEMVEADVCPRKQIYFPKLNS